jgi:ABC-type antimicrobial peptide transport system permease subunit
MKASQPDRGISNKISLAIIIVVLAFRNANRNKTRSGILAIGLIISIGIISGIMAYVDVSSAQLIDRSMDDLAVDVSLNFANRSANFENVTDVLTTLDSMPETEIFESFDPIIGGIPFESAFRAGFAISDSWDYTLSPFGIGANPDFEPTFAFGLTKEYLNRRNSPFTATDTISSQIKDSEIWMSKTLADKNSWEIGDTLNVSYGNGVILSNYAIPMGNSMNVTVSGFVDVDLGLLLENLEAYIPEIADLLPEDILTLIQFQSISADMIFMDWGTMLNFTEPSPMNRIIHGTHLSLDQNKLGSDVDSVRVQLLSIEAKLAHQFPDLVINNFAYNVLENIADKLVNFRLFIIYFSLPGALLGFVFASYVNSLTLNQRYKELVILRLRNTRKPTIASLIGVEVFLVSLSGTGIGLLLGAISGSILSLVDEGDNPIEIFSQNYRDIFRNLTPDSIISSLFIGLVFTSVLSFLFVNQISKLELSQGLRSQSKSYDPGWKKFNIDIGIMIVIGLIFLFSILDFNPIPSFAQTLYDLVVPLFTWIGLCLISLRLIARLLSRSMDFFLTVIPRIIGTTGHAVSKSMVRNRDRIMAPIMIIILTMSFGIVLANVTSTFNYQADLEAQYAVGSDIRIQLPALDQLDYKTDDLHNAIEQIPGLIATDVFITIFPWGNSLALVLAIDPAEFLEVGYFQDDFFYYNTPEQTLSTLSEMEGGLGWIISFDLGFPYADGYDDISKGPPIFKQNQTIEFEEGNEDYEITVLDVAVRLPGLSDLVGRPSDELPYLIMDRRFFIEPLPRQKEPLVPELGNSTHFFIDVDEDVVSISEAKRAIEKVYATLDSEYSIDIRTIDDYNEEFFELGDLLLGLTRLEYVMTLVVLTMTQILFVLAIHEDRKREFAILQGMGWSSKQISRFTSSQLFIIAFLGLITSGIASIFITTAYIPLLSSLFLFPIVNSKFNFTSMLVLVGMLTISSVISIFINKILLERSNIAGTLRET